MGQTLLATFWILFDELIKSLINSIWGLLILQWYWRGNKSKTWMWVDHDSMAILEIVSKRTLKISWPGATWHCSYLASKTLNCTWGSLEETWSARCPLSRTKSRLVYWMLRTTWRSLIRLNSCRQSDYLNDLWKFFFAGYHWFHSVWFQKQQQYIAILRGLCRCLLAKPWASEFRSAWTGSALVNSLWSHVPQEALKMDISSAPRVGEVVRLICVVNACFCAEFGRCNSMQLDVVGSGCH